MVLCLYNVHSKRTEFELFFTKLGTTLPVVVEIEALEEKDLQNFFTSLQKQTVNDTLECISYFKQNTGPREPTLLLV